MKIAPLKHPHQLRQSNKNVLQIGCGCRLWQSHGVGLQKRTGQQQTKHHAFLDLVHLSLHPIQILFLQFVNGNTYPYKLPYFYMG